MDQTNKLFGAVGQKAYDAFRKFGEGRRLFAETFHGIFIAPFQGKKLRWASTVEQMIYIGVNSIAIVSLIAFFVGLIIAMQSAYQLKQFGATIYVANLSAVSMTRELAPLLTAIIIAGRSGSAITAEIGTMKVSEEIDALKTMGFNPVQFLVVPRTIAMLVMLPCLTIIADFIGIAGGYVLAMASLDITSVRYIDQTIYALTFKDLFSGLTKSFFFAIIIAINGAYQGFIARGGADSVGKATTRSVVVSIFLIIVADLVFTLLFYSVS